MSQHESTPPPPPPPPGSPSSPYGGGPSSPYGGSQTGLAGRGTRFFDWMRGLGVTRSDGWLGGVCAGLAYRLGIDPLIVRGIVVVAAILGAPVLLVYAAAWALLPDRENRIHLQRLFDGDFQPAIVGIGILALLSLLPLPQGVWWFGAHPWGEPGWGDVVWRVLWTLIVIALVVGLIVLAARNDWGRAGTTGRGTAPFGQPGAAPSGAPAGPASTAGGTSATGEATAPSGATGPDSTGRGAAAAAAAAATSAAAAVAAGSAAMAAGTAAAATIPTRSTGNATAETGDEGSTGDLASDSATPETPGTPDTPRLDTSAEPQQPPAPTTDASAQDVADWQARQAAWRAEHAQWKERLNADMRAVKAQRSAELRAQSTAMQADAAARRRAYRAANPRVGAAVGWVAIGVALIGAALTSALWTSLTGLPGYELTAALAVATLVLGLTSLIAGLAKRRSGFLTFLGILLAVITLVSAFIPRDRELIFDGAYVSPRSDASYSQVYGQTTIELGASLGKAFHADTPVVDLVKVSGMTTVQIAPGITAQVMGDLHGSALYAYDSAGDLEMHACTPVGGGHCIANYTVGDDDIPDVIVRVDQAGEVTMQQTEGDGQ
ncbi:PspC domain-containing protein [Leifsonia poae]|uniref:Phage shock protein PspC N-terminal domain-containing protein n=1 Tax=Leifsonia poae TaxID=110933 RepID=A0A9W6HAX4_9MICO|nr:PspC domain-containing protein [Leifsonia poae]GLJ76713.1 hypothetical protein GCM10017584_22870 [Leifsonia poae]